MMYITAKHLETGTSFLDDDDRSIIENIADKYGYYHMKVVMPSTRITPEGAKVKEITDEDQNNAGILIFGDLTDEMRKDLESQGYYDTNSFRGLKTIEDLSK